MQLQLQQHREEMQAQERRFREQAERQHADIRLKNNGSASKWKGNRQTWKPCFNNLRILLHQAVSYHREQLQCRVPLLLDPLFLLRSCGKIFGGGFAPLRELMLFQMTERLGFFSPTSRRRCISYSTFKPCCTRNAAEGNQRSYDGSDRAVHEGAIWSNPFRHPGVFQGLDYHATSPREVHLIAGCTHTSSSGHMQYLFHCRPHGRSITYALNLLGELWSG